MSEDRVGRCAPSGGRVVDTEAWRLIVPAHVGDESPLLVVPTVHPRGDRRIIRCAQVALDAGFRVHFIWLGDGEGAKDSAISESLLSGPRNARERIRMVAKIARMAESLNADLWHIHDFYFLGPARRWRRRSGRSVLYDVHEYYAAYYSNKLPLPAVLRRLAARTIERYQVRVAKQVGGVNVVAEAIAEPFRRDGVPVTVSPNYPLLSHFGKLPTIPFADRRWTVVHTGTLSRHYGTELLVRVIARSAERGLPFEFNVVSRFPSPDHERDFAELIARVPAGSRFHLIPPRPTHEIPALLEQAGFGLSVLEGGGQNENAIASKSYEYVMAGLVNVITDRRAQREFTERFGVVVRSGADSADALLDQMLDIATKPESVEARLREKASAAKDLFTWERAVEPALKSQLQALAALRL